MTFFVAGDVGVRAVQLWSHVRLHLLFTVCLGTSCNVVVESGLPTPVSCGDTGATGRRTATAKKKVLREESPRRRRGGGGTRRLRGRIRTRPSCPGPRASSPSPQPLPSVLFFGQAVASAFARRKRDNFTSCRRAGSCSRIPHLLPPSSVPKSCPNNAGEDFGEKLRQKREGGESVCTVQMEN